MAQDAPTIIAVQSRVSVGHVGNSAAVFPLQLAGYDVVEVPTTLLSNHPGYPTMRGRFVAPELVADLLLGITERGVSAGANGIITGYLGDPKTAPVVAEFIQATSAANPRVRVLCDPVMGDEGGVYVDLALPEAFRETLVPLADVITPNQFEFSVLVGHSIQTHADLQIHARALQQRGPRVVVVTGAALKDTPNDRLDVYAVTPNETWRARVPRYPFAPVGTGDLFSALFAAAWFADEDTPRALSRAVSGLDAVLARTLAAGSKELHIVAAGLDLIHPSKLIPAERVE